MQKQLVKTCSVNNKTRNTFAENMILFGILGYMFVILFNGILMHYGLIIYSIERIRPYLPEIFLLVSIIAMLFRSEINFSKDGLLLLGYILIVLFVSFFSYFTFGSIFVVIRDIIIPVLILSIFSTLKTNEHFFNSILNGIKILFILFILVGVFFAQTQRINGFSYMSIYFQGCEIWGVSDKIRISSGTWGLRCLGTTGDAATFGLYNCLAIIFILFTGKRNKILKYLLSSIAIYSIFLSGNKTALVVAVLALFFTLMKLIIKSKMIFRLLTGLATGLFFVCFIYLLFFGEEHWIFSMQQRLILWEQLLNLETITNIFIPHSIFMFSSKGIGGITTFWDNAYLYILYSTGVVGFILFFRILRKIYKKTKNNSFIKWLFISVSLISLSTNIFIGRNIAGFAMIFFALFYSHENSSVKII